MNTKVLVGDNSLLIDGCHRPIFGCPTRSLGVKPLVALAGASPGDRNRPGGYWHALDLKDTCARVMD